MQPLTDVLCVGQEAPCLQAPGAASACCDRRRPKAALVVGLAVVGIVGIVGLLHVFVALLPRADLNRQIKSLSKALLLLVCSLQTQRARVVTLVHTARSGTAARKGRAACAQRRDSLD